MSDEFTATAIANQALDMAGLDFTLGDIEEGSKPSQVVLRHYTTSLQQLLRAANWDWARREGPLQLVADATRQTPDVGIMVPSGFTYSYNYPTDCARVRFLPWNYWDQNSPVPTGNIVPPDPNSPIMPNLIVRLGQPLVPSRFLITNDPNYVPEGASNNLPGISPTGQVLILSNVRNARAVYTYNGFYPNLWDSLFREAMVAFLASKIAFPLGRDKKFARQIRADNIAIAQAAVKNAMVSNGNESFSNADLAVSWMRARYSGGVGPWGMDGHGPGYLFGGLDSIGWGASAPTGNSSAY